MKSLPGVMRLKLAACAVLAALSLAVIAVPDQRAQAQSYTECGWACVWNGDLGEFSCHQAAPFSQLKCGWLGVNMTECWTVDCTIG